MKRLYKSKENRVFAGVIGGIGEYFNVDPVALRVAWVVIVLFTGIVPAVVIYLLSIVIIPEQGKAQ